MVVVVGALASGALGGVIGEKIAEKIFDEFYDDYSKYSDYSCIEKCNKAKSEVDQLKAKLNDQKKEEERIKQNILEELKKEGIASDRFMEYKDLKNMLEKKLNEDISADKQKLNEIDAAIREISNYQVNQ